VEQSNNNSLESIFPTRIQAVKRCHQSRQPGYKHKVVFLLISVLCLLTKLSKCRCLIKTQVPLNCFVMKI